MSTPAPAPTLASLAAATGVSPRTVLRALRGAPFVAPAVAAAVQALATPEQQAALLDGPAAPRRPIAVHVSQFESSSLHELVTAIGADVRRAGYEMLLYSALDVADDFDAGVHPALRGLCDGMLLIRPWMTPSFLRQLEQAHVPAVLVNYCATPTHLPVVIGDNRGGAVQAVQALLAGGHRRIAFVAGTPHSGQSLERQKGYEDALGGAGIAVDDAYVVDGDFTYASGGRAAARLLALAVPPTAIFAANDEMALGAIEAIQGHGLLVPDDISVVGFDDILAASYVAPTLTTVRTPLRAMSQEAVRRIVDAIEGRGWGHARTEFAARLIVRGSSGTVTYKP